MKFVNTFGFRVFSDNLSVIELEEPQKILSTIGPRLYGISTTDSEFETALKNSDYLVLDGVYFALASILINKRNLVKNQGPDIFKHFMERMNESGGKVFFMGSSDEVLQNIKSRAALEYPNVVIDYLSPPYKPKLDDNDNELIFRKINHFAPDVLFVGMTAPKQEKWAYSNKTYLKTKLICSIGAVFDWYGGKEKEIKPIWWKLRLGWLKRTIDKPEVLKRYPLVFIFFWHLFLTLLGIRKVPAVRT